MPEPSIEICPACGVKIEDGAKVVFSTGPSGTRSRLWARVCQFHDRPDCINRDESVIGNVVSNDYYK